MSLKLESKCAMISSPLPSAYLTSVAGVCISAGLAALVSRWYAKIIFHLHTV